MSGSTTWTESRPTGRPVVRQRTRLSPSTHGTLEDRYSVKLVQVIAQAVYVVFSATMLSRIGYIGTLWYADTIHSWCLLNNFSVLVSGCPPSHSSSMLVPSPFSFSTGGVLCHSPSVPLLTITLPNRLEHGQRRRRH